MAQSLSFRSVAMEKARSVGCLLVLQVSQCLSRRAASTAAGIEAGTSRTNDLYRKISALGNCEDGAVAKVLNKWIREGKTVKKFHLVGFIRTLKKYKNFGPALQLYDWMESRGINLSYTDYAIRLHLLYRCKGISMAEQYFKNLSQFAKNQAAYGTLLYCYCNEKMSDKAGETLDEMKKLNFASKPLVYQNLMAMYMKLGQPEKVPALVQQMKDKNMEMNSFTYNMLMNSYASSQDIDAVEKLVEEIETESRAALDWTVYSVLASIYVNNGLLDKAEKALKELEKIAPCDNRLHFHFLISLYAKISNLTEVKRVWQCLKTGFPRIHNLSYLVMLQALGRLDDFDGLQECFKEWESGCINHDIRIINFMIVSYLTRDMFEEAELLYDSALNRGCVPNSRTVELFIEFYLRSLRMNSALKWFRIAAARQKESEWQPSKEKVDLFLKFYEEKGDVTGVEEFYEELKKINSLSLDIYTSVLRTYIAAGKSNPSIRQRMEDDNIKIDIGTEELIERVCHV